MELSHTAPSGAPRLAVAGTLYVPDDPNTSSQPALSLISPETRDFWEEIAASTLGTMVMKGAVRKDAEG
jgi:hypothetical protein